MKADLHIHSALSPCANDDMSPNNIVNMALIAGLDCISVTDHNSLKQQKIMKQVADRIGIHYIYGVEVQTVEDVHIIAYFREENDIETFQSVLNEHLLPIQNDVNYFGNQFLFNEWDEVISHEEVLLIQSLDLSIDELEVQIHRCHGLMCLAHVCDKANSILTQLGFINENLQFDMIEVKNQAQKKHVIEMHPWIKDPFWIVNSDAHFLQDIGLFENIVDEKRLDECWRKWI